MLEPLCGPRHSRAGRPIRARHRLCDLAALPRRARAAICRVAAGHVAAARHPGSPTYDTARATLARLPVKGWDRNTDFVRYRFGEPWSDDVNVEFGHNGCNTRDDILRRDLAELVVRPGTCYAQSGVLHDPYTGAVDRVHPRPRRPLRPSRSTIVVSLSDAWYKGARDWDEQRRRDFANDPRNLLAVGEKPTSTRLFATPPPGCRPTRGSAASSSHGRSTVKAAYRLWVSANEKRAMAACWSAASPARPAAAAV